MCEKAAVKELSDDFVLALKANLNQQDFYLENPTPDKLMELDNEFHHLLFSCVDKERCYRMCCDMGIHFDRIRHLALHTVKELKIVGDHHDILSAICACDADRAYALMAAHLTRFEIDEKLIKNEYPEYFDQLMSNFYCHLCIHIPCYFDCIFIEKFYIISVCIQRLSFCCPYILYFISRREKNMKFGYFDDENREYVITTPKTPLPWINYLGCGEFFSLMSNTCGGYTFYKDAKLLRLTRYRYNDVPNDINGKYFYIKDGDTIWNPGWKPTKTPLDSYECRHGMGYSRFTSSKNGLKAEMLAFVPMNDNCEVTRLILTNLSDKPKTFSVFSYVEFCLWNADDDSRNFQRNLSTGEVEIDGSTIYHKTEYRERRNHYAVYSVNHPIDGFDTIRDEFLGAYRGAHEPEVVEQGHSKNSVASGWSPIASQQINLTLQPGESESLIYVLGYIENPQDEKWEAS